MKLRKLQHVLLPLTTVVACNSAYADTVSLPPLALGNASFMDGVAKPGMLFELPMQIHRSKDATDHYGNAVPGRQKVNSTSILPHIAYISRDKIFGAYYGAEVLLPLVHLEVDIDNGPSGTRSRQGDLIISPLILQWNPVTLFGRPYWQRLNIQFSAPTGDYDRRSSINVGSNIWVFNPHYAFTWELTSRLEVSGRIHYAWASKNTNPAAYLETDSIQPGEAIHGNFSMSYAVAKNWRVGVAGYQLKQITDDRVDGHRQADSKEQVFGIGPGVMYSKEGRSIYATYYVEQGSRNRAEGDQLTLRFMQAF